MSADEELEAAIATAAEKDEEIRQLKEQVKELQSELATRTRGLIHERDVVRAGLAAEIKRRAEDLDKLKRAKEMVKNLSRNLELRGGGSVFKSGLKKFLDQKDASKKVRALCNRHNDLLAIKWWKNDKIFALNWQDFTLDANTVCGVMFYDLREYRTYEMPMSAEWYWWLLPLTVFVMKTFRNAKTVICHNMWVGE